MTEIEWIRSDDDTIAIIIRKKFQPDETSFITPDEFNQQIGFIVYEKGGKIKPHKHLPLERDIIGTSETLLLRSGRVEVDLFNLDRQLIAKRELGEGDILVLVSGGHGFRMLEDSIFIEVKQGPYTGMIEKEIFD
ncbi:MAG: hypothetical protein ACE5Q7_04910 [Candidatus Nitrosomaritimum yanchengensis]